MIWYNKTHLKSFNLYKILQQIFQQIRGRSQL